MPVTKRRKPAAQKVQPQTQPTAVAPRPAINGHEFGSAPALAERMGDKRFAAAQRQTFATQTGQLVGNHTFTRLLNSQSHLSVQRNVGMLGTMALTNVLA